MVLGSCRDSSFFCNVTKKEKNKFFEHFVNGVCRIISPIILKVHCTFKINGVQGFNNS